MFKRLNRKNKIIYWTTTVFFVLIIINSFLIKEIKSKADLTYKSIKIAKIEVKSHQKGIGESISITDSENIQYRITIKTNECLIKNLKKELKPNDLVNVGFLKNNLILEFIYPFFETFSVSKNKVDYIDFKCVTDNSHFGKRKLLVILIILNVCMLYIMIVSQKKVMNNE